MSTIEQKRLFLLACIKRYYPQGDDYQVFLSKKGNWQFGYSNDYPLQHGGGKSFSLPDKMVEAFMAPQENSDA